MKDKIIELLEIKYKSSGGNNGIYITELRKQFEYVELRKTLNQLFKEKIIRASFGVHGKMAMLNKKKITKNRK